MTAEQLNQAIAGVSGNQKREQKGFSMSEILNKQGINSDEMERIKKNISDGLLTSQTSHPNKSTK